MSGHARPIPISRASHSQRSSPIGPMAAGSSSPLATALLHGDFALDAEGGPQSCPVNGNDGAVYLSRPQYHHHHHNHHHHHHHHHHLHHLERAPRAPRMGSLPEPSFLLGEGHVMPELVLPPPADREQSDSRDGEQGSFRGASSFVHFANSCPVDMGGYLRQGLPIQGNNRTPSPRAMDEFDLSKSPALAMMSAMREGRQPPGSLGGNSSFHGNSINSSSFRRHDERYSYREEDELDSPDISAARHSQQLGMGMAQLSLGSRGSLGDDDQRDSGLGGRGSMSSRRGSYDGGVFHFEDQ